MERAWGAPRSTPTSAIGSVGGIALSAGTEAENENISFDLAYVEVATKIGLFSAGYQLDNIWGTIFNDNGRNGYPCGKIGWLLPIGPLYIGGGIYKEGELSSTAKNPNNYVDRDSDKYVAFGIYNFPKSGAFTGEAGLIYTYSRVATYKQNSPFIPGTGAMIYVNTLQPYAKIKVGPVAIEAEFDYYWGKYPAFEDADYGHDVKMENFGLYVDALADFGIVYVGGTFAYISGDDPGTTDKKEGGVNSGGIDWNPCLIMWNFDRTYWAGRLYGYAEGINSPMQNAWFGQIRGGVRPIAALDIMASVSYAVADQKYDNWSESPTLNRTYGTEIDLTATYKITNNLYYMLGIGYLFTGDYFKGTGATNEVRDDYLVINKLTLTF
jgi:hypothetical protein